VKIVITGGGGFIGFKLAKALLARGTLAAEKIARLTLVDQAFPAELPEDPRLATLAGDISDPKFAAHAIAPDTTSVFHLAAVVSGAAEADFDLGMRVNLGGMRAVLDQAGGRIAYRFHARDLHLVLGPGKDGKPVRFRVLLDGQPPGADHGADVDDQGEGVVKEQRLYQLVRQHGDIKDRTFEIQFLDPGAQAFAFTFG